MGTYGAHNGGNRDGAILFSERWLDMKMEQEKLMKKLEQYKNAVNFNTENSYIVYDCNGEKDSAENVAKYFRENGINNTKYFNARQLVDNGSNLEKYKNYDISIPSEIVKLFLSINQVLLMNLIVM